MGKIGRNNPCPCGSGKKYKHCCLKLNNLSVPDQLQSAANNAGYPAEVGNALANLYRYMQRKQWQGACHATASVLYVVLSELGYAPTICIGEVAGNGFYFDHSWIVIGGKIIDLAISMALGMGVPVSGCVVFGKDVTTGKESSFDYGVSGRGLDGQAHSVMNSEFSTYMDMFPDEQNGLWGVVREVLQKEVNIPDLRKKYAHTQRVYVRN